MHLGLNGRTIDVSFLVNRTYMRRVCLLTFRSLAVGFLGSPGNLGALFFFCLEKHGTENNQCWGSWNASGEFQLIAAL